MSGPETIHRRAAARRGRPRSPGGNASPAEGQGDQPSQPSSRGSMRSRTFDGAPTPPTVGERVPARRPKRKRREIEQARVAAELKRSNVTAADRWCRGRRRGGCRCGAGLSGVVAADGQRQCVQEDANGGPIVVPDSDAPATPAAVAAAAASSSTVAVTKYRYYYGSTGTVGSRPVGEDDDRAEGHHRQDVVGQHHRNAAVSAANLPAAAARLEGLVNEQNGAAAELVLSIVEDRARSSARPRSTRPAGTVRTGMNRCTTSSRWTRCWPLRPTSNCCIRCA